MVNLELADIDKSAFNLGGNQGITTAGCIRTCRANRYLIDDVSHIFNALYKIAYIGFGAHRTAPRL